MSVFAVVLVLVAVALLAWAWAAGGRLPKSLRSRACQGRGWREAHPAASQQQIRSFLSLVASAFGFSDEEKLKLATTDEILAIYRAQYPRRWQPDGLELETLARELERRYGLQLRALWNERLTLGELFAHTLVGRE